MYTDQSRELYRGLRRGIKDLQQDRLQEQKAKLQEAPAWGGGETWSAARHSTDCGVTVVH